jgi:glucosamine--fructose-6-phosphate aminotransferase (isomerizing)
MHRKMDSVIQQLLARAAKLVIVCNTGDEAMQAYEKEGCQLIQVCWVEADRVRGGGRGQLNPSPLFFPSQVPETSDALQPVINIVPMQLLSYHLTILKGLNVDQPRNLAKSVTTSEEH